MSLFSSDISVTIFQFGENRSPSRPMRHDWSGWCPRPPGCPSPCRRSLLLTLPCVPLGASGGEEARSPLCFLRSVFFRTCSVVVCPFALRMLCKSRVKYQVTESHVFVGVLFVVFDFFLVPLCISIRGT